MNESVLVRLGVRMAAVILFLMSPVIVPIIVGVLNSWKWRGIVKNFKQQAAGFYVGVYVMLREGRSL